MKSFKKLFGWGTLALAIAVLPTSSHAFFRHMDQGQYEELKNLIQQHNDVESFLEAVKAKKEARRAERKAMKESLTHNTENIDNGIIKTITSDDPEIVKKLQTRMSRRGQGRKFNRRGRHSRQRMR